MKNKSLTNAEDITLFRESLKGVKRIKQDTVVHSAQSKPKVGSTIKLEQEQRDDSFYFSDSYQPLLNDDGPVRYHRPDVEAFEVKKLRRGDYEPELFLDLHGLTQEQAKKEIGALIAACRREHVICACIMHGHGKHVLKTQTPRWLAQHPDVMAFHRATKAFGGDAALLVLITTEQ